MAQVSGQLQSAGSLVVNGKFVSAPGGAPALVFSTQPKPFNQNTIVKGHFPAASGEVAIPEKEANDENLHVGQQVGLTTLGGVQRVTIRASSTSAATCPRSEARPSCRPPSPTRRSGTTASGRPPRSRCGPTRGSRPRAQAAHHRHGAGLGEGADRRRGRRGADRPDRGWHQLVLHPGPPGIRRCRRARGRVRHLQHLLDHGRPAHEGVRDAAHHRGHAAADPAQRAGRGACGRAHRVRHRHRRGCRLREAARGAVRRGRVRAAAGGRDHPPAHR